MFNRIWVGGGRGGKCYSQYCCEENESPERKRDLNTLAQEMTKARGEFESPDANPTTFKYFYSWQTPIIAKGY